MKNTFIKQANIETEYTSEHIQELKKCTEDPSYFINNYCYIQHPLRGRIKFALREYQEKIVKAFLDNRLLLLIQPRQTGKCFFGETFINRCNRPEGIKKVFLWIFYNKIYKDMFK